ncbi:Macrophage migration inhibitory factor homolog [Linum grandiflorum]
MFLQYVMIVLKGSIPIAFGGTEQPAAYGELVSIGGLNPDTNKKLSAAIAAILETKLKVPKGRFFLKFVDSKACRTLNLLFSISCFPNARLYSIYSLAFFRLCLGSTKSRFSTMFACFTPELDNVNKPLELLFSNCDRGLYPIRFVRIRYIIYVLLQIFDLVKRE